MADPDLNADLQKINELAGLSEKKEEPQKPLDKTEIPEVAADRAVAGQQSEMVPKVPPIEDTATSLFNAPTPITPEEIKAKESYKGGGGAMGALQAYKKEAESGKKPPTKPLADIGLEKSKEKAKEQGTYVPNLQSDLDEINAISQKTSQEKPTSIADEIIAAGPQGITQYHKDMVDLTKDPELLNEIYEKAPWYDLGSKYRDVYKFKQSPQNAMSAQKTLASLKQWGKQMGTQGINLLGDIGEDAGKLLNAEDYTNRPYSEKLKEVGADAITGLDEFLGIPVGSYNFGQYHQSGFGIVDDILKKMNGISPERHEANWQQRADVRRLQANRDAITPSNFGVVASGVMRNFMPTLDQVMAENPNLSAEQAEYKLQQDTADIIKKNAPSLLQPATERGKEEIRTGVGLLVPEANAAVVGLEGIGMGMRGLAKAGKAYELQKTISKMPYVAQRVEAATAEDAAKIAYAQRVAEARRVLEEKAKQAAQKADEIGREGYHTIFGKQIPRVGTLAGKGYDLLTSPQQPLTSLLTPALVGGGVGYVENPEHGVWGGVTGAVTGGLLKKYGPAALRQGLGLIRDIDQASEMLNGKVGNVYSIAGQAEDSSAITKRLFGGTTPQSIINAHGLDWLQKNAVPFAMKGVHGGALMGALGILNDTPSDELPSEAIQGALMTMLPSLVHHIGTEAPEVTRNRIRQEDASIRSAMADMPEDSRNTIEQANWQMEIDRRRENYEEMVRQAQDTQAMADNARNPKEKAKFQKVADDTKKMVDHHLSKYIGALTADVPTRLEYNRQFKLAVAQLHELMNGAMRAGQQNIGMEILTTPQIVDRILKTPEFALKINQEGMATATAQAEQIAKQKGFSVDPNSGITLDPQKPVMIINADTLAQHPEGPYRALLHEAGHSLMKIPQYADLLKETKRELLGHVDIVDGKIVGSSKGQYQPQDLWRMFFDKYMNGKSVDEIRAFADPAGLLDQDGKLNVEKVVNYMGEEVMADAIANTLANRFDHGLGGMADHLRDWAHLHQESSWVARAIQNALGVGGRDPRDTSYRPITGVELTPEAAAATDRAARMIHNLNGRVSPLEEVSDRPKMTRKELVANPVLMQRIGGVSGIVKTKMVAKIYDRFGKQIGGAVDIENPLAAEGTWLANDDGTTKQTKGYGQIPDELRGTKLPNGARLEVESQVLYQPDGVTPIWNTPKETKNLRKTRVKMIRDAINNAPNDGTPNRMEPYSADELSMGGTLQPSQIKAIMDLPESIVPLKIKENIIKLNDLIKSGRRSYTDYSTHVDKNGKYVGSTPQIRDNQYTSLHFSKAGNFTAIAISWDALHTKMKLLNQRIPHWFDLWGGNTDKFYDEFVNKYLVNIEQGRPNDVNLDDDPAISVAKRDKFRDFLGFDNKSPTTIYPEKTTIPRKKGEKKADLENVVRSFRLDAMMDIIDSPATSRKMDRNKVLTNFLPADEGEEPAQRVLRPEATRVTPQILKGITAAHTTENRPFGVQYVSPQAQAPKAGIQFMPASAEIREEGTKQHLEFFDRELENSGIKQKPATMAALDEFIHNYVQEKYYTDEGKPSSSLFPKIDPEKIKNYYQKVVRNATPAQAADFPPDWLRIRNMSQEEFDRSFDQDRVDQITQFRVNALAKSANYLLGEMKDPQQTELQKKIIEINDAFASGDIGLWEEKQAELERLNGDTYENLRNEAFRGSYTPSEVAAILNASSKFRINAGYNEEGEMVPLIQNISNGNEAVPNEVSGATASKIAEYMRQGMSSKDAYTKGVFDVIKARAEKRGVYTGWKKYDQSSDMGQAEKLNADCAGTGWCTGGSVGTANSHLTGGDFYLYFDEGSPQIAIRTENGEIAEVRGTGKAQNITAPQYDAEAEKFILGGEGPTGGDKYLHDRNFRKMAVEIIKTGVLPVDAYKYYDQNGVFYPPSPKQRDYGNGFEQEYLQPFIDNAPKTEDILDKNGNLLTGLVWTPEDPNNNKYKNVSGKIMVRVDKRNGETFELPYLESAGEILTANITNVYLPNLKKVGAIGGDSAGEVNLPLLKESGNVWFYYANKINLPQLETASRIHISHANDLIVPKLKTAKSIEFGSQTRMADNKNVDFSSLEKVTTLDIRGPSQVAVPKLEKVKNIDLSLVTAFIAPKLESIDTAFFGNTKIVYAPEVSIRLMYSVKGINEFIGRRSTLLDIVREWKRANPADLSDDPFYYTDPEGNKYNFANQRDFKNIFDVIDGKEVPSKITEPYAGTNEKIVSAVITTPQGKVEKEGATHLELQGPNAPKDPFDREGKWWKFRTYNPHGAPRVVDRREAFSIAEQNGQLKKPKTLQDQVNYDRGVLHSDMVNYARDGDTGIQFMPNISVAPERWHGTGEERVITNAEYRKTKRIPEAGERRGKYVAPPASIKKKFDISEFTAGGKMFDADTGEDVTDRIYSGATIDATGARPSLVSADDQVESLGTGNTYKTNLFKKSAGWEWISKKPPTHAALGNKGEEDPVLVSVAGSFKDTDADHKYALKVNFENAVKMARYSKEANEPRLRPTSKGEITLGNVVGKIRTSQGNVHPVYDTITIGNKPAKGVSFMPADADHAELERRYKEGDEKAKEEAQRLVDEKAKKAGYDYQNVYHASHEQFNEFLTAAEQAEARGEDLDWDESQIGNLGEGHYFTPDISYAKRFGTPRKFHLKINNIVDGRDEDVIKRGREIQQELIEENGGTTQGEVYEELMKEMNADGVIAEGAGGLSYGSTELLVKNSSQAKLADPFTYDKDGNLIPLSQRFNPESNDIRFMPKSEEEESKKRSFDVVPNSFQKLVSAGYTNQFDYKGLSRTFELPVGNINPTENTKDENVQSLVDKMDNGGTFTPIVIDEDNNVVDGHHRLEAAKQMGIDRVPVQQLIRSSLSFMPSSELPKTEDGKVDWEGFKVKTQEIAAPLANLAPLGGISFMPAKKPAITQKGEDDTYLKQALKAGKNGKVKLTRPFRANEALPTMDQLPVIGNQVDRNTFKYNQPAEVIFYEHDGTPVSFKWDGQMLVQPAFKDIAEEHAGKAVQLAMADRQTATGGDMGGVMHTFLKSLRTITIKDPLTGNDLIVVWANNEWKPAKNMKDKVRMFGAKDLLTYLMGEDAHASNTRSVRRISNEIDNSGLNDKEIDTFLILANKGVKTARTAEQNKTINDSTAVIEKAKENIKKQKDPKKKDELKKLIKLAEKSISDAKAKLPQYEITPEEKEFSAIITAFKSSFTGFKRGTRSEANFKAKEKEFYDFLKTPKFTKLRKTIRGKKMIKLDDTFKGRKAAVQNLLGLTINGFNIDHILPMTADFKGGRIHHIVSSVELSTNPELGAVYLGDDPEQAKFMTPLEAAAAAQIKADPNFVVHEAYAWGMLGPLKGNHFLNTNPRTPEEYFPKFRKRYAATKEDAEKAEKITNASESNLVNTMRDQKSFALEMPNKPKK